MHRSVGGCILPAVPNELTGPVGHIYYLLPMSQSVMTPLLFEFSSTA